jgi:hypothetical protein
MSDEEFKHLTKELKNFKKKGFFSFIGNLAGKAMNAVKSVGNAL